MEAYWPYILIVIVTGVVQLGVAYSIYVARKLAAFVQDRIGPNRVGIPLTRIRLKGLGQPLADGVKFMLKEQVIPPHVDKILYVLAPVVMLVPAMIAIAVVPFGPVGGATYNFQIAAPDIGILYVLSIVSLGSYGVLLGGWASNNKYSFLGGLRAVSQMISYEIPLGLSILTVVLWSGSMRLETMLLGQVDGVWNVVPLFPVFVIFLIASFAESNRLPFDLPECEQELVGGFHTEYSGMKFAMFFLAEYSHIITACTIMVVAFLGGYDVPFLAMSSPDKVTLFWTLVKVVVVMAKVSALVVFFMWVRWTLPRFRFDQLLHLGWNVMVPASMVLLVVYTVITYCWGGDATVVPEAVAIAG